MPPETLALQNAFFAGCIFGIVTMLLSAVLFSVISNKFMDDHSRLKFAIGLSLLLGGVVVWGLASIPQ